MYLEFLKITAPIVFNQTFEPGTLGSESKYVNSFICAGMRPLAPSHIGPLPKQQQAVQLCVCMQI